MYDIFTITHNRVRNVGIENTPILTFMHNIVNFRDVIVICILLIYKRHPMTLSII